MNLTLALASSSSALDHDTAVRELVRRAYCNGAYNALDTLAMAQGFHAEFSILGVDGDRIERYTIEEWIAAIERRKLAPGFDITTAKRECHLLDVDITGDSANVKMTVRRDGVLLYTDYLFLLRFAGGWKIVAKIYYDHS